VSALGDACEVVHGDLCEAEDVDLPPDDAPLLDLGDVLSITYAAPDGTVWRHKFEDPPTLYVWEGGIIINTPADERGLKG